MGSIVGFRKDYSNCFAMTILMGPAILLRLTDPFSAEIGSSTIEGCCFDYLLQRYEHLADSMAPLQSTRVEHYRIAITSAE